MAVDSSPITDKGLIMEQINKKQVRELMNNGQLVFAYPRKGVVCVNGFKYYKADQQTIAEVKNAQSKR